MPSLEKEIELHKRLFQEYKKRYSSAFAQLYLKWWDGLITEPIKAIKEGTILDCGCGIGYLARKIAKDKEGVLVVGLDASKEMLGQTEQIGNLFWVVADATSLPFKDKSLDVVICKETLHHLSQPEKALSEFARTLKDGGWLLLSDPCADSLVLTFLRKVCFKVMKRFNPDHGAFKKDQLNRILKRNSFRVMKQYRVGYFAYPLCGLADILPILKLFPFSVLITSYLIKFDTFLGKIPLLRKNNWLIVTHAQKAH